MSSLVSFRRYLGAQLLYLLDHGLSSYWNARSPKVLKWLDPHPDDTVLEIGCGLGLWTSFVAPLVCTTYALDIESKALMIAYERSKLRLSSFKNSSVKLSCAKAEQLPFKNASLSKALAVDVVEHVHDDRAMINEVCRVLEPGGLFVMTTLLEDRPHYFQKITFDDHIQEYTTEGLVSLFRSSELEIQQIFYFYYAPRMIARELQGITQQVRPGRWVGTQILVGIMCRLLGDLEYIWPAGKPSGVGVVAVKQKGATNELRRTAVG